MVQDEVANRIYRGMDAKPAETSKGTKLGISLASGTVAGVAAAICSHPADTLFSLMNKPGAGGEGSMFARMSTIAGEMGFYKLATQGLGARCIRRLARAGAVRRRDVVLIWSSYPSESGLSFSDL